MNLNDDGMNDEADFGLDPDNELNDADLGIYNDNSMLGDDGLGNYMMDDFGAAAGQAAMDKHKDLLKDLTNFAPYMKDTFNNWLGLTWNEETQSYTRNKYMQPIMNMRGAAWCIGVLKTYTRSNNIVTHISEKEYKNIMVDHIYNIWLNLGTRRDLGIKEPGDLLRVCNELEHAAALALMGAGDGKYNKMLSHTFTHHSTDSGPGFAQGPQTIINTGNMKKPGLMTKIKQQFI